MSEKNERLERLLDALEIHAVAHMDTRVEEVRQAIRDLFAKVEAERDELERRIDALHEGRNALREALDKCRTQRDEAIAERDGLRKSLDDALNRGNGSYRP